MDIGTLFEWVARVFGLAFLVFMLLVLIIPSWHEPQRQRHASTPQFRYDHTDDRARHDAA